jgi:hypothetical protein
MPQSRFNHKQFLFRRMAWRIQANAWGGLSERARQVYRSLSARLPRPASAARQPKDGPRCRAIPSGAGGERAL